MVKLEKYCRFMQDMKHMMAVQTGPSVAELVTVYDISRHGSYGTSDLSVKILLSDRQTDFADWFYSFGSTAV